MKTNAYYYSTVQDLILKARAYDRMHEVLHSDMSTASIFTSLGFIVADTEEELHVAADNRVRIEQNI